MAADPSAHAVTTHSRAETTSGGTAGSPKPVKPPKCLKVWVSWPRGMLNDSALILGIPGVSVALHVGASSPLPSGKLHPNLFFPLDGVEWCAICDVLSLFDFNLCLPQPDPRRLKSADSLLIVSSGGSAHPKPVPMCLSLRVG